MKTFLIYMYVIYVLFCNGTVFLGVLYGNMISVIIFPVFILAAIHRKRIIKQNFARFSILAILFILSQIINAYNEINWVHVILLLEKMAVVAIAQGFLSHKQFIKVFVNCLCMISLISIITYFLYIYQPNILQPFIMYKLVNNTIYVMTYWHTIGWGIAFNRNAGPFWEPGMFACYLIIGLFFLLFIDEIFSSKYKKVVSVIFIMTILTTKSAMGYLTLTFMMIAYIFKYHDVSKRFFFMKYVFTLFILFICIMLTNTPIIQDKFFSDNSSIQARTLDLYGGISIILKNPFFGVGYKSALSEQLEIELGTGGSSNGLIQGIYRGGGLFFTVLLFFYYCGCKQLLSKKFEAVILYIILLMLMASQPIQFFSIILLFAYKFSDEIISQNIECKPQFN
ncbi:hypothetical protein OXPF_31570 [Oxobacter pfennigii]|uniref:O-antigen ligase-related domain-containing protein n=1 Tax=Oxobacter pfennigii TaxID=36849 RepID=A0A0P8W6P7_9CLOT|nr:O-antigen ligase family protein [Oxobacter pfennigii]KPU43715.1 hypothetical protein OXPF_31570 [Oxobacter pfennigii]